MRKLVKIIALMTALLLTACASGEDIYYGSWPAEDVYLTQTVKHTCTLIACTMMLRNCACQRDVSYAGVTDAAVRSLGWSTEYGLSHSFVVEGMEVACSDEIRRVADKKQYLIDCLKKCPGGVVIYDTGAPHAIWLFGYDQGGDIFWCADTIVSRGGHEMPLVATSIRGETQQDKIDTIDKIWYVANREYRS
ncbi:MAG: hypothetical protein IJ646_09595 [Clostridia bacterium]|nr:hypothetical protein [Clostridia bacterium]